VPADRTIVDVLREAGVDILTSCEEGTCGTCETPVVAGVPDHRDSVLTDEEQAAGDRLLPCVSRCLGSRLVLDL
jgi:ferredoxin